MWTEGKLTWKPAQQSALAELTETEEKILDWTGRLGVVTTMSVSVITGTKKEANQRLRKMSKEGTLRQGRLEIDEKHVTIYGLPEKTLDHEREVRRRLIIERIVSAFAGLYEVSWKEGIMRVNNCEWEVVPLIEPIPRPRGEPLWIGQDWAMLEKIVRHFGGLASIPELAEKGTVMKWGGNWQPFSIN